MEYDRTLFHYAKRVQKMGETSYHISGKCCAYMVSRYSILGVHTMEPEKLGKVRPTTLLWFERATKRFS